MPTYEYECRACGHAFETMHSMTAPVLRKCPKCGKLKLERLISGGAGVIFKGSGFYETDYKRNRGGGSSDKGSSESRKAEPAKSDASEKTSDAKAESKSDSKPAAKPETKSKKD